MNHQRDRLLWCGLCLLTVCFPTNCSQDCSSGSCGSSEDSGNVTYKMVTVTRGTRAVDMCFVVSAATTMASSQLWLQTAVPVMEDKLTTIGIGLERATPNRYCLVQFGGRGRYLRGRFLYVNGNKFFSADEFFQARRQLRKLGDVADGYEAIEFLLQRAPFRNDPMIAKSVVLASNMGRSVLATVNVTRESLFNLLVEAEVVLDSVVDVQFSVQEEGTTQTVLGLHDLHKVSVVEPNEKFSIVESHNIQYSSNQGSTVHDYVTLALATGGSSWPISLLAQSNYSVLVSFVQAYISAHGLERTSSQVVCQRCTCARDAAVTGVPDSTVNCQGQLCEEHEDQELCSCLVSQPPLKCGVIAPTPVIPTHVTSTMPQRTPRPLIISGNIEQFPGGDVELNFESTINRAKYECVLVTNGTTIPNLASCTNPYYLKSLPAGHHRLLVIGKRKDSIGTRLFDFVILPEGNVPTANLTLNSFPAGNGSVGVSITWRGLTRVDARLQCSVGGGHFFPCESVHVLQSEEIGEEGVMFIAVAIDDAGLATAAVLHVEKPHIKPDGHVMIQIVSVDSPDPFGRIRIRYNTSRNDVYCLCRVNITSVDCLSQEYLADPRVLGAGAHDLSITCMDHDGYVDKKNVKFLLTVPVTPPPGPLSCDIRLSTERELLIASYTCDRRIIATCQVSSLPTEPCNAPSGIYEADISTLGPGPHVFILSVDDGYGKSLMKILPFSIGTANRKCCPAIVRNSTVSPVHNSNSHQAQLDVYVTPGNCSLVEGFSYTINWGDGASEMGTLETLSNLHSSRLYESAGNNVVDITYCNNPAAEHNVCCDSLSLQLLVS